MKGRLTQCAVRSRLLLVYKDLHMNRVGQWSLREIHIQLLTGNERVHIVWRPFLEPFKHLQKRERWLALDQRTNVQKALFNLRAHLFEKFVKESDRCLYIL